MTILVVFVSCSKLAEFLHVAFISVEKHYPVFFSAGFLFVFEILRMQKLVFVTFHGISSIMVMTRARVP